CMDLLNGASARSERCRCVDVFGKLEKLCTRSTCPYRCVGEVAVFFFKQKTAYEIGLGIPAEPLFRSLLWKTPIFPSNSRFPRLCAKCLLKLKRLVSILPMTKSKK